MNTFLAAIEIGGTGMINQLLTFLLLGICVGLVYAAGWWFIKNPPVPPIVLKIWQGLFIIVGLIVIINFLLGLTGNPIIKW